ncbi:hypothetical protein QOT17_017966 [Balamuthia mandrillaris]
MVWFTAEKEKNDDDIIELEVGRMGVGGEGVGNTPAGLDALPARRKRKKLRPLLGRLRILLRIYGSQGTMTLIFLFALFAAIFFFFRQLPTIATSLRPGAREFEVPRIVSEHCEHQSKHRNINEEGKEEFSVIDKTVYNYWQDAMTPEKSHQFLDLLDIQYNTARLDSYKAVEVVVPQTISNEVFVSVENFVWARNVLRGARTFYKDKVVVVSSIWKGFHEFLLALTAHGEENVVFIVLRSHGIHVNTQLPELGIYFLESKESSELALIEQADLYISLNGLHAKDAVEKARTPTMVLYSGRKLPSALDTFEVRPLLNFGEILPPSLARQTKLMLNKPKVDVIFHSYLDPTMGYGSSAEQMVLALDRRNISVRYYPKAGPPRKGLKDLIKERTWSLVERTETSDTYLGYFVPHEVDVNRIHPLARKAKVAVIYTTFETTKVPSKWPRIVNLYDKLLVSCPDIQKAFADGGVNIPIDIIPLGVDTTDWPLLPRSIGMPFRFLLFADSAWSNHRKNYPLVYEAFVKEFAQTPQEMEQVELWIKITKKDDAFKELEPHIPPNLKVFTGRYTQKKLLQMMKSANCLVFPSHGEGYGLPPREAMSTGLPAIFAGFAGLHSIANNTFNYPLAWTTEKASGYSVWKPENEGLFLLFFTWHLITSTKP